MSFSRFSVSGLFVGLMAFVASACDSATEPRRPGDSYDLVSYEGKQLPVETRVIVAIPSEPGGAGYRCSDRLTALNLRFDKGASFTQTESRLLVCDDGRPDVPSSTVINGTFELGGGTLVLNIDLGDGLSERSAARFSDVGLTVYHRDILQDGVARSFTDEPLEFAATQ